MGILEEIGKYEYIGKNWASLGISENIGQARIYRKRLGKRGYIGRDWVSVGITKNIKQR